MTKRDLSGLIFGRATVISSAKSTLYGASRWNCKCSCGKQFTCFGASLIKGVTKSCGCLRADKHLKHGCASRHGTTPEYKAWNNAITRCYNPYSKSYPTYGGRGITVCDEWKYDFSAFLLYIGNKPDVASSLDRIDNNGNYAPGNVRWASKTTQARNRAYVKLSLDKAKEIRSLHKEGFSNLSISRRYNIDRKTVWSVLHGEIWKESVAL